MTLVEPITISSSNCAEVVGLSWQWVYSFARKHGVPIWRLSPRKPLIPARALLDAMATAARERDQHERSFDDELADELRDFTREISISTKPK